jgi:hypothetical protein
MYDPVTSALIRSAPDLPNLDLENLPDELARAFAEIVSARVMLRTEDGDPNTLSKTIGFARRLALTNEALVAINPDRENRSTFDNLGIKKVAVDSGTVKAHPKLLVTAVWCIADVQYEFSEDARTSPWVLETIKPIQIAKVDYDSYKAARAQFDKDEWIDLLMQSIGFNPDAFGRRSKLLYSFYFKTRKFSWVMTRKLSDTLSRNFVHSCGMVSRMNARMASANCF